MPEFRTMAEAAAACDAQGCPYTWVKKDGTGFKVVRPAQSKAKKKAKKKAKRRTKKTAVRRAPPRRRKKATKKRAKKRTTKKRAKKRTTKKKAAKKRSPWGASITGTTPRAKFMRAKKKEGASPAQAKARWNLKRGAKSRAKKRR